MRKNKKGGLFAGLEQRLLRSEAFVQLSPYSKIAILELEMIYWEGGRNNPMLISQISLAQWLGCSTKTAQKVLTELDDLGFLYRERAGKLKGPLAGRTAIYRLTWRADNDGVPATKDFMRYKPSDGVNCANRQKKIFV